MDLTHGETQMPLQRTGMHWQWKQREDTDMHWQWKTTREHWHALTMKNSVRVHETCTDHNVDVHWATTESTNKTKTLLEWRLFEKQKRACARDTCKHPFWWKDGCDISLSDSVYYPCGAFLSTMTAKQAKHRTVPQCRLEHWVWLSQTEMWLPHTSQEVSREDCNRHRPLLHEQLP